MIPFAATIEPSRKRGGRGILVPLFSTTLFASAFLLFWCQPMVGKMVLPLLGGAASVWTTCVLFFQAMLLAGYMYAHLLGRFFGPGRQVYIHLAMLLLPLAFLPIDFGGVRPEFQQQPSIWLLLKLTATAGVPFFVISASAPLLQNWFAGTGHGSARDPYFLYAASNTGSLLALIAYPFAVEPRLGIDAQSMVWHAGYVVLMAAFLLVSVQVLKLAPNNPNRDEPRGSPAGKARAYWLVAAFVPSALMLAVTNHITANLAAAPFLWIAPLAIYLVTFIIAFARRFRASSDGISRVIPFVLLAVFPLAAADVVAPPGLNWLVILAHAVLLYCGALLCHTRLAESRPHSGNLTEFYFWIALGGALGGVFTATLAPAVFNTVLEYPLLVAALPFFRKPAVGKAAPGWRVPAMFAAGVALTLIVFRITGLGSDSEAQALAHTSFLFLIYKFRHDSQRFALAFVPLIAAYSFVLPGYIEDAQRVHVSRNFFGVKKVLEDPETGFRRLMHGDTTHGIESTVHERRGQPLSYYHPAGPVGDVMAVMNRRPGPQHFAVIGLGSGTMAAHGGPRRRITFYEIDPAVERIAREYFSFLGNCGASCDVTIGDGRLALDRAPEGTFDLLMVDAFSSDSIPAHLVSREAVELYVSKLAPGGLLLFHVSNRFLNIERLVSALVHDAGLAGFTRFDEAGDLRAEGKSNSNHVLAARRTEDLGMIPLSGLWKPVTHTAGFRVWTDEYSNLLGIVRWR